MRAQGRRISAIVVQSLWPVPETAIAAAMYGIDRIVVPELNPGLYRREIERLAGGRTVVGVERLDGELIAPAQILEAAA
jgi:2-oxoglutarate ferredoxin oxidoreductase subunit alpha